MFNDDVGDDENFKLVRCCATGDISPVSGTANDLRNDVRIGSIIAKSADSSGVNTTYCLRGPTGSRLAARFVS